MYVLLEFWQKIMAIPNEPTIVVHDNNQYGDGCLTFWVMLLRDSLQKCQQCGLNPTNSQCPSKSKPIKANGNNEIVAQIS